MAAVYSFNQWWLSSHLWLVLYQLEIQWQMRRVVPAVFSKYARPVPTSVSCSCRSSCCHCSPSIFQGLKMLRSLKSALFHQVSPDISNPLWTSLLLFFPVLESYYWGSAVAGLFLCENFLQLVQLRAARWGHSHPRGFPPRCFPQCLAPWVIGGEFVWFSVKNPK